MTNTQYKQTPIPGQVQLGDGEGVRWPAELYRAPWAKVMRAQDTVLSGRRVHVCQHSGGSASWLIDNSTPGAGGPTQTFPGPDDVRTVARSKGTLAPGSQLELRVLAVPAGATEALGGDGDYALADVAGAVRVLATWANGTDTESETYEVEFEGSEEVDGAEDTDDGAAWSGLIAAHIELMAPAGAVDELAEGAKWSEWPELTLEVQHVGGARVIQVLAQERPIAHTVLHTAEQVSAHGYPLALEHPDDFPQEESADGANYEEHRHGTHRALEVIERQSARMGPRVAAWSAWAEGTAAFDDTEADARAITSSAYEGVSAGAGVTDWDADAPGFDVPGGYARRAPEGLRLPNAAQLLVHCRVYCRYSAAGSAVGRVRWQSTERSYLEAVVRQSTVGTTWTWVEVTGWLEASVAGDDVFANLVDLATTTAGTLEIRYWDICSSAA